MKGRTSGRRARSSRRAALKSRKTRKSRKTKTRKSRKLRRNFGSIYGLQGSDLSYKGVYPMEMNKMGVKEIFPNLFNVKRDYTLN